MPDCDAHGTIGDPACGDSLTFYLRVRDNRIEEVSYLVLGCCGAIATSSITSELAKGKTLEEACEITEEEVIKALDGLPESKVHCSVLGVKALHKAIDQYFAKSEGERK